MIIQTIIMGLSWYVKQYSYSYTIRTVVCNISALSCVWHMTVSMHYVYWYTICTLCILAYTIYTGVQCVTYDDNHNQARHIYSGMQYVCSFMCVTYDSNHTLCILVYNIYPICTGRTLCILAYTIYTGVQCVTYEDNHNQARYIQWYAICLLFHVCDIWRNHALYILVWGGYD